MERDRAVEVTKQILESCGACQSVTLLLDHRNSPLEVYQIQISIKDSPSNDYFLSSIEKIAIQNGLLIKQKGSNLIIYKAQDRPKEQ